MYSDFEISAFKVNLQYKVTKLFCDQASQKFDTDFKKGMYLIIIHVWCLFGINYILS